MNSYYTTNPPGPWHEEISVCTGGVPLSTFRQNVNVKKKGLMSMQDLLLALVGGAIGGALYFIAKDVILQS